VHDDDWAAWLAEQQPDDERPCSVGCLLVVALCVLFWVLIVAGAVMMYPG